MEQQKIHLFLLRVIKRLWIIFLLIPAFLSAQELSNVTELWIGNTYPGGADPSDAEYLQNQLFGMDVSSNGTVYTASEWDEDGRCHGIYKDGQVITDKIKSDDGFWCWGTAGRAVSVDADYHYYVSNCEGLLRYKRSDNTRMGKIDHGSDSLALSMDVRNGHLYIVFKGGEVQMWNTSDMSKVRTFTVSGADDITVDSKDDLWINCGSTVKHYSNTGSDLGDDISQSGWEPSALAMDDQGRLMIADQSSDMQVLFYDVSGSPVLDETFGVQGGEYEGTTSGLADDPQKLWGHITGIGCDDNGNIFVGMWYEGVEIRSFATDGTLNWKLQSYPFLDTYGFDPASNGADIYGAIRRFKIDLDDYSGKIWSREANTMHLFDQTDDPRQGEWISSPSQGCVFMENVDGNRLMYATGQNSGKIGVWYFEGEYAQHVNTYTDVDWGVMPDQNGNIWYENGNEIYKISLDGFNNGVPQFGSATHVSDIPSPFSDIERLEYDAENDVMYIGGDTPDRPETSWGLIGTVLPGMITGVRVIGQRNIRLILP